MAKYDQTDLEILDLLQEDGRVTIKEVAAQLGLSSTPTFERIKRLERNGLIRKYVALLNPELLNRALNAFVHISIIDHSRKGLQTFIKQITAHKEVMECHHVSGDSDFLLKVVVRDMEQYHQYVTTRLATVSNIGNVRSTFSLAVNKTTTAYHVVLSDLPTKR